MNVVSLVFLAFLAQAGTQTADPEAKAKAQALLREGAESYRQGAFAGALEKFGQAYAVFPSPKLLYNIGQANRELGRPADAVDAFEKFLAQAPDASPDLIAEAKQSVAELSPKIGKLFVNCNVSGARITVDGKHVGKTPLADFVRLSPGSHQVMATHPSTMSEVQTVTVAAGAVETVGISLRSPAEAAPAAQVSNPPTTPTIDLQAASTASESPATRGWWLGRKWTWVAAGSTVVLLGAAAIAGWSMQSEYDDLRRSCGTAAGANWTGCKSDDISALDTRKNIANVFWGLSAAAAVTTGVLFFVEGRRVALAPMAGETTGLVATVRY
jgi:hypothetical protein